MKEGGRMPKPVKKINLIDSRTHKESHHFTTQGGTGGVRLFGVKTKVSGAAYVKFDPVAKEFIYKDDRTALSGKNVGGKLTYEYGGTIADRGKKGRNRARTQG